TACLSTTTSSSLRTTSCSPALISGPPIVDKQAVPKERLRVDTDTSTEERTVSEEIRREQIDVEREPKKR
ncbi:MAG: hypothetical protein DLM65_12420, partial [Candidatus Aeolococcus gillhamiae]